MAGILWVPSPTGPAWFPDSSGIKRYEMEKIDQAITKRDEVIKDLFDKLKDLNISLEDLLIDTPLLDAALGDLSVGIPPPFVRPDKPVRPNLPTDFPSPPAEVALGTVDNIILDDVPVLTAVAPDIREITPPTPLTKTAPVADALPTRDFPDAPSYTLPDAPTLRALTLPTAPSLIQVDFAGVLPADLAAPPDTTLEFTEVEYQSILNDELKDKLLSLVLNLHQTGLSDAVMAQMWDKARERTAAEATRRRAAVRRQFAALGWNMPQGDEAILLQQAEEAAITDDITESRNIAITEAQLEQSNFQFAFTQALALENQLINLHNNVQQRSLERAKAEIDALVSLYQLQVSYYNAGVTMYGVQATVFKERIQAELAKLELYKAELEGQKLIGELNTQDIANYTAQINAINTIFELYKAELTGVKTKLEGDALKIQQFEANIRAFSEEIKAKSLEYEGYKAELSGEDVKATIYASLVNAFSKEIDAYSATTDAKLKKLDADIKVNFDVPLSILKQRTDVYKLRNEAKTAEIDGLVKIYETDGRVYSSEADAEKAILEGELKRMEMDLAYLSKQVDVDIEVFKQNVAIILAQKDMLIAARKTETQLKAQIAASIGGAVNFSTNMSATSAYANAVPTSFVF